MRLVLIYLNSIKLFKPDHDPPSPSYTNLDIFFSPIISKKENTAISSILSSTEIKTLFSHLLLIKVPNMMVCPNFLQVFLENH